MHIPTPENLDRIRIDGSNDASRCLAKALKTRDDHATSVYLYLAYAKAKGSVRYSATHIMGGIQKTSYVFPDGSAIVELRQYAGDPTRPSPYGSAYRFIPTLATLLPTIMDGYDPTVRSLQPFEYA